MAQYVGRKSISKNIPPNIPAISYKYSSKYPHNRLLENHDRILRADAASYLIVLSRKKNNMMKIKPQLKEAMYFGIKRYGSSEADLN